jgi:DNA-binding transcriptional MerR regulator
MGILNELWTTKEAAERIGISEQTLFRWRRESRGPPYLRVEGRVYYRPKDIDTWIKESPAT